MKFDWSADKAAKNLRKHGISFEKAITVFDDPNSLVRLDVKHSAWEMRERLLGESDIGILMVVFTVRQNTFRIISARMANKRERSIYEYFKRS